VTTGPQLRVATRGSPLARWQAEHIVTLLEAAHPGLDATLVLIETTGDRRTDAPLTELGGQGVFVKEVQQAVLDGRAEVAVHSAKDLPSITAPGLALGAVPERGDPRDVLVGRSLEQLAVGAVVATGSVRRQAQLAVLRPDLQFVGLRGNIGTRLAKVPPDGAIVMAAAALERLGLADQIAEWLAPEVMVPQVGQGALAVEARAVDDATRGLVAAIEHGPSRTVVDLERAFLAELGGGCDLPVGAHAVLEADGRLRIEAFLAGASQVWRDRWIGAADDAPAQAVELARAALAGAGGTLR
jgi:hydroxymethylbilane synthase